MAQFVLFGQNFSIPDSYIRDYEMKKRLALGLERKRKRNLKHGMKSVLELKKL